MLHEHSHSPKVWNDRNFKEFSFLDKRKKSNQSKYVILDDDCLVLNVYGLWILEGVYMCLDPYLPTLSVVEVLLCSYLKDDLYKLNLVLNSFSISPIYVSWLFKVVSVIAALYTTHLVRHLPSIGQEFFADSYIVCCLEMILSFCPVVVSDGCYWRLSF